jgi:ribulose 1,5-bisphosphate carboxylase large subunit-like protein
MEKIHEFSFKAAKKLRFFDFKFKMSFQQEKFSVTKT